VVFAPQMEIYTAGVQQVQIDARDYRHACRVLSAQFPLLTEQVFAAYGVAINDVMIQAPLLETLNSGSELIFIPKIAAG